ncbi:MAG: RpiB/LacA/LacB family sugar-phosphate isomerase [Lachnospiraceae bacterium]|nr:RpiB/LacA/LacB family sugar-phosphate isomerase [Lachnospiraceae bacterium]
MMKIAVIQASSQIEKNRLLFQYTRQAAPDSEVLNFGCTSSEAHSYSYLEISLLAGLLLNSGAVDFVVTGCSSGQGMMLACNSIPGVLCGYAPTPMDAYLFAQINNGNAISVPLGEDYTWQGEENLQKTLKKLFSEPFGQGWPKSQAERKIRDSRLVKEIRRKGQKSYLEFMESLDKGLVEKILRKTDVLEYVKKNGVEEEIRNWITK